MIETILFVTLGVTLGIAAIVFAIRLDQKRHKAMKAFATKNGLMFIGSSRAHSKTYAGYEPFGTGTSRTARFILQGQSEGHRFEVFQYQYTTQTGKSSTTHYYRVCVIQTPILSAPLSIKPEHWGHKVFDALGGEDLDFESHDFSRRFWVKAADREQAYAILEPRMQAWLLELGPVRLQWHGNRLMLIESGRLKPSHVQPMLAAVGGFVARLPRHLVKPKRTLA